MDIFSWSLSNHAWIIVSVYVSVQRYSTDQVYSLCMVEDMVTLHC